MTRCLALILFGNWAGVLGAAELSPDEHFQQRVWPLMERACVKCHGVEKQKADLRLDSREAALRGGESGPALVPGKPKDSLLFRLIRHAEANRDRMPPKQKLAESEIADVEKWIAAGAPWPKVAVAPPLVAGEKIGDAWSDPRNPIVRIFGGRRLDLWSLKPVSEPAPPVVKAKEWARNEIDHFILAPLEAAGLSPTPEAERRVLARRVWFDLTGLPPTPEELSAFLSDPAPDAYERLVDRLLASRRYGEHWARMWLDVARYSDSNGFDWDEWRPQAWRFRDYVVRSFNADKPFDQFIREQLAGDELVPGEPQNEGEQDALIATGFLRLGPQDNSAGSFGEERKVRQQWMADLVETTGAAFLGLTMSCCRCHDHKYDPLSQADHYRLQAFFEPLKTRDDLAVDLAKTQSAIRKSNAAIDGQVNTLKQEIAKLSEPALSKLIEAQMAKLTPEEKKVVQAGGKPADELKLKKRKRAEEKVRDALDAETKEKVKAIEGKIAEIEKGRKPFTNVLAATDREDDIPPTRVLEGGNVDQPKDSVAPGILSALDPAPAKTQPPPRKGSSGRRLALAQWLVSGENPLTARVLVNRVWQSYFGSGIVATPSDFGLAGAKPTHPELLDWLATDFRNAGWSLKQLHRRIVTSATYRQSSTISPGEAAQTPAALQRQTTRRLTAEMLRDAMLTVSGRMIDYPGGPPIWPELPEDIRNANPALLDDNKEKTKGWYPSPPEKTPARSLYLIQKRTVPVPLMATFDLPDNAVSCARRSNSTVAPQALTLLNSDFAVQTARAFAARVLHEAGADPSKQTDRTFALALQRPPDPEERETCIRFLNERGLPELCRAILNLNEFVYID